MAWVETYKLEYYDIYDILWTAILSTENFAGDSVDLQGSGEAIGFEFTNGSDNAFDPYKPSNVILSVIGDTNFSYNSLYSVDSMQTLVQVYQGEASDGNLYWEGYVDPNAVSEPYDVPSFVVKIGCYDGLTLLEEILFADEASDDVEYYDGRQTLSEIVINVLGKIGFTEFKEFVNLYDDEMDSGVGDSPFDQTSIDVDVFEGMYCDEVLIEICKMKNACIRQQDGIFCIYRLVEIKETTVYGRHFTDATTKTSISYTTEQFINRSDHDTNLKQAPGGVKIMVNPLSKVSSHQDYGYNDSLVDNWKFPGDSFSTVDGGTTYDVDNWTEINTPKPVPFSQAKPGASEGVLLTGYQTEAAVVDYDVYIEQDFAINTLSSSTDIFEISFDYAIYNWGILELTDAPVRVTVEDSSGTYWLDVSTKDLCVWRAYEDDILITVASTPASTLSEWTTFRRRIVGLPAGGAYTIKLYGPSGELGHVFHSVAFKNVKFIATSDAISINKAPLPRFWRTALGLFSKKTVTRRIYKINEVEEIVGTDYAATNNINGAILNKHYLLGDVTDTDIDVVIDQFKGSLGVSIPDTYAFAAARFAANYAAAYLVGGVVVTSSGAGIIFTAQVAGVDFTGVTSRVNNVTGSLGCSIVNTTPNGGETQAEWEINLSGTGGTANITANDTTEQAIFNGSLIQTAIDFVTDHAAAFLLDGVEVSNDSGDILTFKSSALFSTDPVIANTSDDLDGAETKIHDLVEGIKRVDTITLDSGLGSVGTCSITVDAKQHTASLIYALIYPTDNWNPRNETLDQPILEIAVDEIANQYSRASQFIDMPIQETSGETTLNLLGTIIDNLNVYDGLTDIREVADWTKTNCTLALTGGYARFTSTAVDPNFLKVVSIKGWAYRYISYRYKIISGTPATGGEVFYKTAGHDYSASYYRNTAAFVADGQWHIRVEDMADLTAGGTDWVDNVITGLRIDLTYDDAIVIDLDWIGFPRRFMINRGSFKARSRKWKLDLLEIV